jgi:hypothetical protein
MIEWIIRITVVLVLAVAAANVLHGASIAVRLVRYAARRYGHLGLWLWLPTFRTRRDVMEWVATWRAILGGGDPAVAAIRRDGREVVGRYTQLVLLANTWALAVWAVVPRVG